MASPPTRFAVVGDVIGSRKLDDRPRLGTKLDQALKKTANADWQAPPIRTRGVDEFSALASTPQAAITLAEALCLRATPIPVRIAIAEGPLDVRAKGRDASKMDGPAFHRAAETLERAKHEQLWIAFALDKDPTAQRLAEQSLALAFNVINEWTDRVRDVAILARQNHTQAQIASKLDISQQAVSAALARGKADRAFRILDAAQHWLTNLYNPATTTHTT